MHEECGIDIISNNSSSLFDCKISYIAIEEGAVEAIKYFHSLNVDFSIEEDIGDFKGQNGIEVAIIYSQEEILNFFTSVGYDVNQAREKNAFEIFIRYAMNSYDYDETTSLLFKGFTT